MIGQPIAACICKGLDWQYEREWRLVRRLSTDKSGEPIQMPNPKCVYLGARIRPEHEEAVRKAVQTRDVPICRMLVSATEFRLGVS